MELIEVKRLICAKQLTRWSVAEHEQYNIGALKRKRRVKQSGNVLNNITIHLYNMYKSVEK
jgi:hypothetical protein